MDTALLIIDAQRNMFEPEPVYQAGKLLTTLETLIHRARAAGVPVIFIRQNGSSGKENAPHSPGWEFHPRLTPLPSEAIVDKHTPDAFYQTELAGLLASQAIRRLIIAGMLTEYCIDATCRRAFGLEYEVTLAADGHSTGSGTLRDSLTAEQVIAHHNRVLQAFADVRPAAEITFDNPPPPAFNLDALTAADRSAIRIGLDEWQAYDTWLATGEGNPFWPHTHPSRFADTLKSMWDPTFTTRGRYLDPPRWELGIARAFLRPLENIPPAFRKANLQAVKGAVDHLLQNPRNPLSAQIRPLDDQLWLYDSRDLRLFYVPQVTRDSGGNERHYIFLVWLSPGVPVFNPFA